MNDSNPLPIEELGPQDRRFLHALQALALPAAAQQSLFPDIVITDELAIEYWDAFMPFLSDKGFILEGQHVEPLYAVDDALDHLTDHVPEAWAHQALQTHASWKNIRELASAALSALGWPLEKPLGYQSLTRR